ncbi:hypothetical protein CAOEGIBSW744_0927 [Cardinium endosymbiont of Oedothorax gibbosus]|nr:hypothetical protein CAOEGIBSW744_0927 [Cardinium endosymbiont of Oedothorax gibbosus]
MRLAHFMRQDILIGIACVVLSIKPHAKTNNGSRLL